MKSTKTGPTTSVASLPIYACCWNDKKAKNIITNAGDATPGKPSVRRRHCIVTDADGKTTKRYKKVIERPQMIEVFYEAFNTIDVHDHLRQGSLAMEKSWQTKTWWHRVLCTVIAMCVVDAYRMYEYEHSHLEHTKHTDALTFHRFCCKLAYHLVHFPSEKDDIMTRSKTAKTVTCDTVSAISFTKEAILILFSIISPTSAYHFLIFDLF